MHRFNINLEEEDYEKLLVIASRETIELKKQVPVTEIIRRAIKEYLEKNS